MKRGCRLLPPTDDSFFDEVVGVRFDPTRWTTSRMPPWSSLIGRRKESSSSPTHWPTTGRNADGQPGRFTSGKRNITSDEARYDLPHARFRFYDADHNGPVNLEHVFVMSGRSNFPVECKSILESIDAAANDCFHPHRADFWPLEQQAHDFVVLTRTPLLYSEVGQNLMHMTEVFRFRVEDAPAKSLYYYYHPTPPDYSPHNSPCDNLPRGRHCLAVL